MSDYGQRYLDALLPHVGGAKRVIGEISPTKTSQPHSAAFLELESGRCLATTLGISCLAMPLPVRQGFSYFELCALTERDSPAVLWLLSNFANFMLSQMSPFFHGSDEDKLAVTRKEREPTPFHPYETLRLGGDDARFIFVPRWQVQVAMGPRVDVVEPLPISAADWERLSPRAARGASRLGPRARRCHRGTLERRDGRVKLTGSRAP
jgi:hypothetical protein